MGLLEILVIIVCVLIVLSVIINYIVGIKKGKTCCSDCDGCSCSGACKKKKATEEAKKCNCCQGNEADKVDK